MDRCPLCNGTLRRPHRGEDANTVLAQHFASSCTATQDRATQQLVTEAGGPGGEAPVGNQATPGPDRGS